MMKSITPGPWEAKDLECNRYGFFSKPRYMVSSTIVEGCQGIIASVHGEANTRLIAAAPEMYELLKKFVYVAGFVNASIDGTYRPQVKFGRDILDKADILLRRIDGEE